MENKMRIRKVHLLSMIQVLNEMFEKGVDFVDVHGTIIDGQDTIGFSFCKSYMDEEFADEFDNLTEEQQSASIKVKLSDDDLNQLI